jgi:predicted dehydrogenase
MKSNPSRRTFIRQLGGSSLLIAAGSLKSIASESNEKRVIPYKQRISANDKIRIATIGLGIMGHADTDTALRVPGVELTAVCDLYTGRLTRAKEKYGEHIFITRDYREILLRKDIDAVIIATSDHWHARISIDAMNSGKAVYCEKPVVQKISDGLAVIATQKKTGKPMQVGSQLVSSIVNHKAREVYQSGVIGQLNCIEAYYDRQSAIGAWEYTMPSDGSPKPLTGTAIRGMSRMP